MKRNNNQNTASTHPLHQHAEDNLRFIRNSMESSLSFTGVSGRGYIAGGLSALAASWLASQQVTANLWLSVWGLELLLAASLMLAFTMRKCQLQGSSFFSSASGRKILFAFTPCMAAGAVLSAMLVNQDLYNFLPALWLLNYGAAIATAGAHSVKAIPFMGLAFFVLGLIAASTSVNTDILLGLGFGGIHMLWGIYIWRQHGG